MQEKIDIEIITVRLTVDDCRHLPPNGETWGFYPVRCEGTVIEVNYDLIAVNGREYLL